MKKFIISNAFLGIVFITNVFGQNQIILKFSAQHTGSPIVLDSIRVENLTQGGDTMLYFPDTVLVLFTNSIFDYEDSMNDNLSVSQNYPNPFKEQTIINVFLPESDLVTINIFDIMGRVVAYYENMLNAGNHFFSFFCSREGYYFFTVRRNNDIKSIKMINFGREENEGIFKIFYNGSIEGSKRLQSTKTNFVFSVGDILRYSGFATPCSGIVGVDVIQDTVYESENYLFEILGIPSAPTAYVGSSVTQTSFTAKWTASPGATTYFLDIATNDSFTNFVQGYNNLNVGNVISYNVTDVSCGTTYYFRVRASNYCGTSSNSNTADATTSSCCTNQWIQKVDFGGAGRMEAVGFFIGTKGYIGTGWGGSNVFFNDFWEYDPSTNVWTQKYFAGTERDDAVSFSIGSKGYIGTGWDPVFTYRRDFWEYNPSTNQWTQKADFGGTARFGAVGFSIGSNGYIGTGRDVTGSKKDFWEYKPSTNIWTQKADFGGTARHGAVGFSIGTKGYIGTGLGGGGYIKDFWEYNPSTNQWTQKADFGGTARSRAVGFSIETRGYIGTGYDGSYKKDFWEYNPSTNSWTQKADFGGTARDAAVGFSIGTKGYIGTGYDGAAKKDFWEYCP